MDRRLTPRERLALYAHLGMCRLCRRFRRQIRFLRSAAARAQLSALAGVRLDDAAKDRIRARIRASL